MITKLFEIRDRGTCIPALAVQVGCPQWGNTPAENWLLERAGYGRPMVILTFLEGSRNAEYDPFAWNDRTMRTAHKYIEEHFDELESGAVICVEYILGERGTPKVSERLEPS
jgi:hypothetical protein